MGPRLPGAGAQLAIGEVGQHLAGAPADVSRCRRTLAPLRAVDRKLSGVAFGRGRLIVFAGWGRAALERNRNATFFIASSADSGGGACGAAPSAECVICKSSASKPQRQPQRLPLPARSWRR